MKKISIVKGVIVMMFIGSLSSLFAQNRVIQLPTEKKYIEVTGSAEMNIPPNIVALEIELSTRLINGDTSDIEEIDKAFFDILMKNKIDKKNVAISGYQNGWYWWYWWSYRGRNESSRKYTLTLSNETNFLKLLKDLDEPFTRYINIKQTTHDEIQKYRKEVKKEAMKAAREKAAYLLESVDEEIGGLLFVEEVPKHTNNNHYYWRNQPLSISNSVIDYQPTSNETVDNVSTIRLRYEIKARFEIK